MGLRPPQVHEDAVGGHRGINDLRRVFNGAVYRRVNGALLNLCSWR